MKTEPFRRPTSATAAARQDAPIEQDRTLVEIMTTGIKDDTELFKQLMDNESFKH